MKTPKSSDSEEVTPSKKVLKQARLPFKTLSDLSPQPTTPVSRKRKLSAQAAEPLTKVGKVVKHDEKEEILVISDDDSNTGSDVKKVPTQLNPFVKLVDTAWKKKLQKTKGGKKKKSGAKKAKTITNGSVENIENKCDENESGNVECVEKMDVDVDTKEKITENPAKDIKTNTEEVVHNLNSTQVTTNDDSKPANLLDKSISSTDSKNDIESPDLNKHNENTDDKNSTDNDSKLMKSPNKDLLKSPKRSERIKSKIEDKVSDTSVNCDESLSSDPSTPRRSNRNQSLTNSQGDVSMSDSTNTNLTPKQLQKKLESTKKKEEKEKERLEREKKKQLEKEEREKQRREKEEQRKREREEKEEAKKKEREEKEELRKKEKEEKEKQRELEKKQKEEKEEQKRKEKEEKEEQRKKEKEAREDEKRKKQEAIEQEKQEQEQKKKKAAEAFVSFFVPKQKTEKDQVTIKSVSKNDMLSSFTIKSDMRLAPTVRVRLNNEDIKCLDNLLQEQNVPEKSLYIKSLKEGMRKPLTDTKTWPLSDQNDDDDVMIVEDELPPPVDAVSQIITCESVPHEKLRPKLLAFHDNRRPPYWGTWRKKSAFIKARQPFKTDEKLLDYEVDSDEDWEEEQDGESIDGSAAGSDDEQDADEYEVDNEVFVPHGYLSDEEATMDEDDVLTLSPETQKARLKHLEDEFENEMKKPTEKLKPWYYGLSWETEDEKPEKCADSIWNYFGKFSMIMNDPPQLQPSNDNVEPEKKKVKRKKTPDGEKQSPKSEKKKKAKVEEKDGKKPKTDNKKTNQETLKNQPGINTFLKKLKTS
ncbi:chromatin assembly factor 1 subunit A [Bicyclus anynana]|uniref:Chromatin assembly factor 1 subunit A n=1 Tax=Bicyclus anynana TaxID=110368 RepID=A0ABM3LU81_BICAN|nr:chromatin assembly factor 1 subunit A [Bicyclus anynana]